MVKIDLKGLAKVNSKKRDYYYAWRGGPRLKGEPGSPEFVASFNEAIESLSATDETRFRSVIISYRASQPYKKLADSTKRNWSRCLAEIESYFGSLRTAQFDRPEKIRPIIRKWRNKWAEKPRTADYHMQVLSRVLGHAVDPLGVIASNPCEGVKSLYSTDRSELIWQPEDIARLKGACSAEIGWAADLAAYTGLRQGDLLRLSWSHVGDNAITISTGKSRHRRTAIIPLYDDLRTVLAQIPKRSTVILTTTRGTPWKSFDSLFSQAKKEAGIEGLRFHDLRGTAATNFYLAGIPERAIAEIMAWEEEFVAKIIRRYVDRSAATKNLIDLMNRRNKKGE
jgi:integrase